ncbi:MAG: hypothetical protein CVV24_09820 [Ignavibacteriae bacterium HGW-Ignavibacteriae-3]|nr:MAG: hypothetical protein CVV24_09820 [Ignavibacteriae bacterium HGW-Ignavibacteriae-3]
MDNYLKALKQNVCSICVDSNAKGGCTLNEKETCAVELFLPEIVNVIHSSHSEDFRELYLELQETVCVKCRTQEDGNCYLREDANCSLDRYFSLIVETIQKVDAGLIN